LLAGHYRDAIVGSDLHIGCGMGVTVAALSEISACKYVRPARNIALYRRSIWGTGDFLPICGRPLIVAVLGQVLTGVAISLIVGFFL
jgi:hypothetical protein